MSEQKFFIMGLPNAGKTTYLAAFWYILNNSNSCNYKIHKYISDHSYIVDISNKWANGEELSRTGVSSEKLKMELSLKTKSEEIIKIVIPDLSGESFQQQLINREIQIEHVNLIKECNGVILFIHPEKIIEPQLISDIPSKIRVNDIDDTNQDYIQWDIKSMPTQVQLVELLQFIKAIRNEIEIPLVIVISAWDLVEKEKSVNTPAELIERKLPLLWQYLNSNSKFFRIKKCGLSAQGVNLSEKELFLKYDDPCDRVFIIDLEGKKSMDITLPFHWLISGKNEL